LLVRPALFRRTMNDSGAPSRGSTTPGLPGPPQRGGGGQSRCCSVSREGTDVQVIEQQTQLLHGLHEKLAQHSRASSTGNLGEATQELQNMSKMVNLIKEQQTAEFAKFREVMNDLIAQQKGVMDRQKNLQKDIGEQKATLDRQETLVQQVLDQVSLDKEFEELDQHKFKPRTSFANGFAGHHHHHHHHSHDHHRSDNRHDTGGVDQMVPNASPRDDEKDYNRDHLMGGDEPQEEIQRKDKKEITVDMENGGSSKSKKSKKNRRSVEGRSNINVNAAPWNQEHEADVDSIDAPVLANNQQEEEDDLFPCLARMSKSSYFRFFFAGLILTNTIFVAVQVQHTAKNPDSQAPPLYITVSDMAFCILFVFEIVVRMLVERCSFFRSETRYWNMFDLALVVLAFQEQISSFVLIARGQVQEVMRGEDDGDKGNFTFLRMVRMLRVLRILRVFKFCPQLIVLVQGILESMSAMVWLFALLGLTCFIASLIFMSATANYIKSQYGEEETEHLKEMKNYFGTLSGSLFSLFKTISGGLEWEKLGDGLMKISQVYGILFILFLAFVIFGIVNVMTGVFVISAMRTAKQTDEDIKRKHFIEMKEFLESLTNELEPDLLDRDIFMFNLETDEAPLRELLKPLELGVGDAAHLYDLMMDKNGKVTPVKLTQAFLRLLGGARSTDLVFVLLETRRLANELFGFFCFCEANFRTLSTAVGVPNGTRRYLTKS